MQAVSLGGSAPITIQKNKEPWNTTFDGHRGTYVLLQHNSCLHTFCHICVYLVHVSSLTPSCPPDDSLT